MNEELVLHILSTACYGLNLQFHLIPQAPYLYIFFDRAPDQVLNYPQVAENIRVAVASAQLPAEYEYLALYGRIAGHEEPDWETSLYIYYTSDPAQSDVQGDASPLQGDAGAEQSSRSEISPAVSNVAADQAEVLTDLPESDLDSPPESFIDTVIASLPSPLEEAEVTPAPVDSAPAEVPHEDTPAIFSEASAPPPPAPPPEQVETGKGTTDKPKDDFSDMAQFYFKAKTKPKSAAASPDPQPPAQAAPATQQPAPAAAEQQPATPPPQSRTPAPAQAVTATDADLAQYCFIRNKLMLTSPIKPPSSEVIDVVKRFHSFSGADKAQALPLLVLVYQQPEKKEEGDTNLYQPGEVDTQGLPETLQQWFQMLMALEPESFRKSAIWLSRYCANPSKAIADLQA